MKHKVICKTCGKEFEVLPSTIKNNKGIYCCVECQYIGMKKAIKVSCSICGKNYEVTPSKQCITYICKDCRNKRAKGVDKICPVCGKKFNVTYKNRNKICCCYKCSREYIKKYNKVLILDTHAEIIINSKKWGMKKCLIDKEDIDKVKELTWQVKYTKETNCFYIVSSKSNKKEIKIHRFITNCPENKIVDHINHNPLDNRRINLRICTAKTNNATQSLRKDNKSGYAGISKTKSNKWRVVHSRKTLGTYNTLEQAIEVKQNYIKNIIEQDI